MENTDDFGAGVTDHIPGIVLGIPGVNDDWTSHFRGERQLRRERGPLCRTWRVVVMIIEAAFPDGDRARSEMPANRGNVAGGIESSRIMGVNTSRREDEPAVGRGELRGEIRCFQRLANAHDRLRARVAGARDYRVAVAGERRVREVGVAVDEDGRVPVLRGHFRSIQRSTGAAT